MTRREALRLLRQLASSDVQESESASNELHQFVIEASDLENSCGKRPKVLDTIESGLADLLCDSAVLAARREDDYANSIICIAKAIAWRAGAIVPALSGVFLQADADTSWQASEALALIFYSNGNSDALRVLVSSTSGDRRPELRRTAVNALGLLGNKGVAVQRLVRTLLKDEDAEVCKAAILGLAKQRGAGLPAVRELTKMLNQDSQLTDYLQYAVEEITGKPSPVSRPRSVGSLYTGHAAFDDPIYKEGWQVHLATDAEYQRAIKERPPARSDGGSLAGNSILARNQRQTF